MPSEFEGLEPITDLPPPLPMIRPTSSTDPELGRMRTYLVVRRPGLQARLGPPQETPPVGNEPIPSVGKPYSNQRGKNGGKKSRTRRNKKRQNRRKSNKRYSRRR